MNNLEIDIQIESKEANIPIDSEIVEWTKAALEKKNAEITVRIVDEPESTALNKCYRKKDGPTNVLSFPLSSPHHDNVLLGDIVICAPLISKEATEQNKPLKDHWAHLIIHGILHLQGYDHIQEKDAKIMETKETAILSELGIANPYD